MARILIVDDERQIRRILALVLRERRHQIAEASSGEEALDLAPGYRPDVVLLDLKMPGIDGLETLSQLQEQREGFDVIMMTAHGSIGESRYGFTEIIGISPSIQEVFRTMAKVARVDATVLVTGESGTGKELVARAIHRKSRRAERPFVAVNCSERGAFTDAHAMRPGKFEQADSGTLFLDEAGDLALDAQAKLLRALQEKQIVRLGSQKSRPVDVRVVAATNKDLEQEVAAGRFREDLYWRLNVVHLRLPPLRERQQDLRGSALVRRSGGRNPERD